MTEEEKRFKILKKTKYEEQLDKEKKDLIIQTIAVGIWTGATVNAFSIWGGNTDEVGVFIYLIACLIGTNTWHNISILFKKLFKIANLEEKIEDIDIEMEIEKEIESEENKGMKL